MSAFGGKADSASLGRVHKELHLGLSQVFARPQICVGTPLRRNCSIYDAWRDQGKPQQARELLSPVYGWFTEGFDTRDLIEAKTLLEALAS